MIAILAEIDALPGISQAAVPGIRQHWIRSPVMPAAIIYSGSGSVAAAIAVKNWLQETGMKGRFASMARPQKKVAVARSIVRAGLFKDVDVVAAH